MSGNNARVFQDSPAVRGPTQLLFGLIGPSGSGKTFSALRLATGIQRVSGGEIFVLDSEHGRALHYATHFRFRHVPFEKPYSAMDYEAAINHCIKKGAKIIVIDSTSHLHEGDGGTLEWHEREVERIMAAWKCNEDKANVPAWAKPKRALRNFIEFFTHIDCHIVFCFKARDKIKVGGGKVTQLGFMPIVSEELVFELTAKALLLPGANGVPTWQSNEVGERTMIKLPEQFRALFTGAAGKPFDESIGEQLAEWAAGKQAPGTGELPPSAEDYAACADNPVFDALERRRADHWKKLPAEQKATLKAASDAAAARLPKLTNALDGSGAPAEETTQGKEQPGSARNGSDHIPQFDKASAIAAIKEAGSKPDLEKAWAAIALDYRMSNREIEPDIEDAVKAHREVLSKF